MMNDQRQQESSCPKTLGESTGPATLLDRLHGLLQRQLALVRQDQWAAAVALFEETDECVRQIAETRSLEGQVATAQWQDIERLYQQLSRVLAAQRAEVSAALDATQRARSALKIYGHHLSSR